MKSAKTPARTARPVAVIVEVTRFKDILATKPFRGGIGTEYKMEMARNDSRAYIEGDNLYIKPPGAPVQFTLTSRTGDRERYYPLGIAFVREGVRSKSDEERLGFLNFPQRQTRAEGRTLFINDTYRDSKKVRYKFSLYIQRGSDGAIGVIDPGLVHTGVH